jgi:tetratricopeptide (TPR) repeat protein
MQWGRVEANVPLPDDWFSPPDFERTPLQHLVESLFGQRGDPDAVMWTYHGFRRAYPGVDTAAAVNLAGYQVLKMGNTDTAIRLLRENARAYPDSAGVHFELGRALEAAGEAGPATEAYRRTLAIDPRHERARRALAALGD